MMLADSGGDVLGAGRAWHLILPMALLMLIVLMAMLMLLLEPDYASDGNDACEPTHSD